MIYKVGMKGTGPERVRQTIAALNQFAADGASFIKVMSESKFFNLDIGVYTDLESSSQGGPNHDDDWNPVPDYIGGPSTVNLNFAVNRGFVDEAENRHSPASGLYHELLHANLRYEEIKVFNNAKTREQIAQAKDWMQKRKAWGKEKPKIDGYSNNEEYFVTRAEARYQKAFLGEQERKNHRGKPYTVKGVFSTEITKGKYPTYKK